MLHSKEQPAGGHDDAYLVSKSVSMREATLQWEVKSVVVFISSINWHESVQGLVRLPGGKKVLKFSPYGSNVSMVFLNHTPELVALALTTKESRKLWSEGMCPLGPGISDWKNEVSRGGAAVLRGCDGIVGCETLWGRGPESKGSCLQV